MTKREAKRLSVLKWKIIVSKDGACNAYDLPDEVKELRAYCGYCEKYQRDPDYTCGKCPLNLDHVGFGDIGCHQPGHPWDAWVEKGTKENAQKVLDLIKQS